MTLELGKLYLWDRLGSARPNNGEFQSLVLIVSSEKVKPIYTKYNIFVLEDNRSEKVIIDKFHHEEFLKEFKEVTDEEQILKARKKAGKK